MELSSKQLLIMQTKVTQIWGFHGRDDSRRRLLGCDAVFCCGTMPAFRCPLPSAISYTLKMEAARGSETLVSYHVTVSQPRRPRHKV
jgi:hypothetical protein